MMTRSGANARAAFSASSPSATGSTSKPLAFSTSQNSFLLRSLSSTTRILFVIAWFTRGRSIDGPAGPSTIPYVPSGSLTILHGRKSPDQSATGAESLALAALGWVLSDDDRAARLLALTGLTPDILRDRLSDRGVLAAVLEFLINHEPDLIEAADTLQVKPQDIVAAHESLSR